MLLGYGYIIIHQAQTTSELDAIKTEYGLVYYTIDDYDQLLTTESE